MERNVADRGNFAFCNAAMELAWAEHLESMPPSSEAYVIIRDSDGFSVLSETYISWGFRCEERELDVTLVFRASLEWCENYNPQRQLFYSS